MNPYYDPERERAVRALIQTLPLTRSIQIASFQRDTQCATDYVLSANEVTLAVRCRNNDRKNAQRSNLLEDVTVRTRSSGGGETELPKLLRKAVQLYLYIWMIGPTIQNYCLWDVARAVDAGLLASLYAKKDNHDGTWFDYIKTSDLENAGAMICKSWDAPTFIPVRPLPAPTTVLYEQGLLL